MPPNDRCLWSCNEWCICPSPVCTDSKTIVGGSQVHHSWCIHIRRSENSVHLYDGFFLFPLGTKRLPHTLQRCWSLALCWSIQKLTERWQSMPIIHRKQIRDLHGERKNMTRSKSCLRLVTCVFSIMLRTDRLGNLSGVHLMSLNLPLRQWCKSGMRA